jgi:hypothetical protein
MFLGKGMLVCGFRTSGKNQVNIKFGDNLP